MPTGFGMPKPARCPNRSHWPGVVRVSGWGIVTFGVWENESLEPARVPIHTALSYTALGE